MQALQQRPHIGALHQTAVIDDGDITAEALGLLAVAAREAEEEARLVAEADDLTAAEQEIANVEDVITKGVDGIVFVADSCESRFEANIESLYNLHDNLKEYDLSLETIPFVMQWNKRDVPDALPVAELNEELNPEGYDNFEAVAIKGVGVFDTLKCVAKQVLRNLQAAAA